MCNRTCYSYSPSTFFIPIFHLTLHILLPSFVARIIHKLSLLPMQSRFTTCLPIIKLSLFVYHSPLFLTPFMLRLIFFISKLVVISWNPHLENNFAFICTYRKKGTLFRPRYHFVFKDHTKTVRLQMCTKCWNKYASLLLYCLKVIYIADQSLIKTFELLALSQ